MSFAVKKYRNGPSFRYAPFRLVFVVSYKSRNETQWNDGLRAVDGIKQPAERGTAEEWLHKQPRELRPYRVFL